MQHLPISVDLRDRDCLVVGAGAVAGRKALLLRRAGARVTVVAPSASAGIERLQAQGEVHWMRGRFDAALLAGRRLVIAATDDDALNRQVAEAADAAGILCNVVDDRELSTFILPAIVDRDPVTVAISTGGDAPVLAQRLKSQIEAWLPARIGELARRAGRWRALVRRRFRSIDMRRRFWQHFFDGPIADAVLGGRDAAADALMRRELIDGGEPDATGAGWIVGAGPGDPGLLTVRAQQLLSRADVVLYDHLVAAPILDLARKEAELICVGKRAGAHSHSQDAINELLVRRVRAGQRVCRLKGGDPFVFGRGGEEAAALAAAGLPFEIVPGISAALGCAAYAGIPLTLRGVSNRVLLATASLQDGDEADWHALARPGQTLALYMSLGKLREVARTLTRHGLAADTPAAVVASGSTERQRTVFAPLSGIARRTAEAGIESPAMLFVGSSVGVAASLQWFGGGAVGEASARRTA